VVTEYIPPYAIAVGSPAKVIKYRFSESRIEKLLRIRWWDWQEETIRDNLDLLQQEMTDEIIDKLERVSKK